MASYKKPDSDQEKLLRQVLERTDPRNKEPYHKDLIDTEARIGLLLAYPSYDEDATPKGPAITEKGQACAYKVRICSTEQRARYGKDAEILVDGLEWDDQWDLAEQEAVLDGALYALEVQRNKDGEILSDDQGRPKMKVRIPDLYMKGYREIARRHRAASLEVKQLAQAQTDYDQLRFEWDQQEPKPAARGRGKAKTNARPVQ